MSDIGKKRNHIQHEEQFSLFPINTASIFISVIIFIFLSFKVLASILLYHMKSNYGFVLHITSAMFIWKLTNVNEHIVFFALF
jgi:hypothetical protein